MFFDFTLRAPDFPPTLQWLNTKEPLSLKQLRGHVVVLDFWTYCCINCIHILPDLKWLEEKYKDQPVVVIGVHAAKFLNEQKIENIQSAVTRYQIDHPVVVDNQHSIWDSFSVRAWPTFVVIDPEGSVKAHFSGEGHRQDLDNAIQKILVEARHKHTLSKSKIVIEKNPEQMTGALSFPGKICLDLSQKQLFISDTNHHRILHTQFITPTKVEVKAIIGSEKADLIDGEYRHAAFHQPQGLCLDENEQALYVCDTENHSLRKVDLKSKVVSTIAGTGKQARWGDRGGPARQTALSSPWDIVMQIVRQQPVFYLAMAGAHQIWQYDPGSGNVVAWAGNGQENIVDGPRTTAQLAQTSGLSLCRENIYFADSEVSAVRQLNLKSNEVTTLIGHGLFTFGLQDGNFDDALLQHPLGLHAEGELIYVADTYNHALRLMNLKTRQISTLIKREAHNVCSINDKNCDILPLNEPNDVKKMDDYLYIADTNNHLIRAYNLKQKTLEDVEIIGL